MSWGKENPTKQHVFPWLMHFSDTPFALLKNKTEKKKAPLHSQFVILACNTSCKGENERQEESLWYCVCVCVGGS